MCAMLGTAGLCVITKGVVVVLSVRERERLSPLGPVEHKLLQSRGSTKQGNVFIANNQPCTVLWFFGRLKPSRGGGGGHFIYYFSEGSHFG